MDPEPHGRTCVEPSVGWVLRLLCVTIASWSGCGLRAQPAARIQSPFAYAFSSFNIDAGLPSNVASVVFQTRDGYLWVGTEAGLARFDGVRFTIFRVADTPGLADNLIRCFYEDKAGT